MSGVRIDTAQLAPSIGGDAAAFAAAGPLLMAGVGGGITQPAGDYATAVSDTLLCASGLMLLALPIAIADLIRHRPPASHDSCAPCGRGRRKLTSSSQVGNRTLAKTSGYSVAPVSVGEA